jgi:beta-aspartyl-peptidase (threonine type)
MPTRTLVIHGGAGLIQRHSLTPDREAACRRDLEAALSAGAAYLSDGGSALDAVEAAVRVLEASPFFNAGRGAVLNADGQAELDASIMVGTGRRAGAVAGIRRFLHPITIARRLMEDGQHVMQAGEGAERFALSQGLEPVPAASLIVPERLAQWHNHGAGAAPTLDHDTDPPMDVYGTVGAVALDTTGELAAATSTGGMMHKRVGRLSDSALIGAGTWAQSGICAVSCTGHGEYFIRLGAAHRVAALMDLSGRSLADATAHVLSDLDAMGGTGGLIAIDAAGNVATPFNTAGMFHGVWREGDGGRVGIWD